MGIEKSSELLTDSVVGQTKNWVVPGTCMSGLEFHF